MGSSDVWRGDDMRQSHMHFGTDMHSAIVDLFIHSHMPALSVMRGNRHMRSRDIDMRGVVNVSGINNLYRDNHVRAARSDHRKLSHLSGVRKLCWRNVVRCRADVPAEHKLQPGWIHLRGAADM